MSLLRRIGESISALARGEDLSAVFERLARDPEDSAAFTIAVIALGAKMAKADGRVTRAEIAAFREIFHIAPEDERAAARIYNLARRDVAGFQSYARRIARMFRDRPRVLAELLEGLAYIAASDGHFHADEAAFLEEVARIFEIPEAEFRAIRARYLPGESDPYQVLGVDPDIDDAALARHYRRLVRELHPDRLVGDGVPEECRHLAEQRLAAVNEAYRTIRESRKALA